MVGVLSRCPGNPAPVNRDLHPHCAASLATSAAKARILPSSVWSRTMVPLMRVMVAALITPVDAVLVLALVGDSPGENVGPLRDYAVQEVAVVGARRH